MLRYMVDEVQPDQMLMDEIEVLWKEVHLC